jgi:hypothetical protein
MRGKTLGHVLTLLRAEARLSLNPAHNAQSRDTQVSAVQRVQELLCDDINWPHLRVDRYLDLQAGQRFYDVTTTLDVAGNTKNDVVVDKVDQIFVMDAGEWRPLSPQIGRGEYAQFQSDRDQRSWPVHNWRLYEDEQVEIWPVPSESADTTSLEGRLKIVAYRKCRPLVADSDICDLDDRLLALFAAVEFIPDEKLARYKSDLANRRLLKLTGNLVKERRFRMFGIGAADDDRRKLRGPPTVYYRKDT